MYLPSPNLGLTPPGTYNPNVCGSDACRGAIVYGPGALDRYTRAGIPECVVSTMAGSSPETEQDRTQERIYAVVNNVTPQVLHNTWVEIGDFPATIVYFYSYGG